MQSYKIKLTDNWQKALDNQIGSIRNQGINAVSIYIGPNPDDAQAITLPAEGFSFQQAETVWAKNYNSAVAVIGLIK